MHSWMKRRWLVLTALALLAVGCAQPDPDSTGSARFVVAIQEATAAEVARIQVTVSAPDMPPLTAELTKTGSTWSGGLASIPAGPGRDFFAEAFDATGTKRFSGHTPGVTISSAETAWVSISLQETSPAPGFEDATPYIASVVASADRVVAGGTVTLRVDARDPDLGDTLTYSWMASVGSFDDATRPSLTWTAPAVAGSALLTVTVTDSRGASASFSFILGVISGDGG